MKNIYELFYNNFKNVLVYIPTISSNIRKQYIDNKEIIKENENLIVENNKDFLISRYKRLFSNRINICLPAYLKNHLDFFLQNHCIIKMRKLHT